MNRRHPDLDVIFIESGGDNLFCLPPSPRILADLKRAIYVIPVLPSARGEKIPRKGGPGVSSSDLLVINKTDLRKPYVGADLAVMRSDAAKARGDRPVVFSDPDPAGRGGGPSRRLSPRWGGLAERV